MPQKGGAKKAVDVVKKFRQQEPSDRLVKIISEIPEEPTEDKSKPGRAAKEVEI